MLIHCSDGSHGIGFHQDAWFCVCVCVCVYVKLILSIISVLYNSGRVAKEVMEQSAKIKREPPEIHR